MNIKSFTKYALVFLFGAIAATATSAFASNGLEQIKALIVKDISVVINGEVATFDNPMLNYDGKTYLYLRDFERFGMKVDWDGEKRQIDVDTNSLTDGVHGEQSSTTDINIDATPSNPITSTDDFIPLSDVVKSKNFDLYGFRYSNNHYSLVRYKDKSHNITEFDVIIETVPVVIVDGKSHITREYYDNTILPLLKI